MYVVSWVSYIYLCRPLLAKYVGVDMCVCVQKCMGVSAHAPVCKCVFVETNQGT